MFKEAVKNIQEILDASNFFFNNAITTLTMIQGLSYHISYKPRAKTIAGHMVRAAERFWRPRGKSAK